MATADGDGVAPAGARMDGAAMVAQGAAPDALGLGVRPRARARGEDADDLIPGERGYVDVAAPGEAAVLVLDDAGAQRVDAAGAHRDARPGGDLAHDVGEARVPGGPHERGLAAAVDDLIADAERVAGRLRPCLRFYRDDVRAMPLAVDDEVARGLRARAVEQGDDGVDVGPSGAVGADGVVEDL